MIVILWWTHGCSDNKNIHYNTLKSHTDTKSYRGAPYRDEQELAVMATSIECCRFFSGGLAVGQVQHLDYYYSLLFLMENKFRD